MSSMETYHGHVKSPQDAIVLFEACRLGLLPRVQRRLSEKERQQIRSGSVFVWDEREASMRRWTDGKSWSASRVSGSFLTYREMEGKRGGTGMTPTNGKKGSRGDGKDSDQDGADDGPDGYRYKQDGLMKQSFSITTADNRHLHLISYYARPHANCAPLKQPTSDAMLRSVQPQKGLYPEAAILDTSPAQNTSRGQTQGGQYAVSGPAQQFQPLAAQSFSASPWPTSPVRTPPTNSGSYPQTTLAHSPHNAQTASSFPGFAAPSGPTTFDRPPPPPAHPALPLPVSEAGAPYHNQFILPRNHPLPPFAAAGPASVLQPNPYGSASAEPSRFDARTSPKQASQSAPQIAPISKPPTPPASSNGATPSEVSPEVDQLSLPALADPRKQISASQPMSNSRLPTISALLNDPLEYAGDVRGPRSNSRSPLGMGYRPPHHDLPNVMTAGGFQKAQHDLEKLKSQFLK